MKDIFKSTFFFYINLMKILIIGNPIASGGDAGGIILSLKDALEKRGHIAEAYLTKFAGDGTNRIKKAEKNLDRIVIVGGDGTVNEIVNGIDDDMKTPLLQIPTGNANLLAKDLKLPKKIDAVINLIENGKVVMADIAEMNGNRFIMVAGAGFDARVTEILKEKRKGRVSNFSYLAPIFKAIKKHSRSEFFVEIDGEKEVRGSIVLVCNIRNYAGLFDMADDADIESNDLDIIVFPSDKFLNLLKYAFFGIFSRISNLKEVEYTKAKKVKIKSERPIPIQLDGDFQGRFNEVEINLLDKKIPLIVPQ